MARGGDANMQSSLRQDQKWPPTCSCFACVDHTRAGERGSERVAVVDQVGWKTNHPEIDADVSALSKFCTTVF